MVPVLSSEDGRWLLPEPLQPLMKPGGHGAIWKLMLDEGVFEWLSNRRREAAIVRQIRYSTAYQNIPNHPYALACGSGQFVAFLTGHVPYKG